jgi:hypothetical protein
VSAGDAPAPTITEEAGVPAYTLPPLARDGQSRSAARAASLALLRRELYGELPPLACALEPELVDEGRTADGLHRRQWRVTLRSARAERVFELALHAPAAPASAGSRPVALGLNFLGNHTIAADPALRAPDCAEPASPEAFRLPGTAEVSRRGEQARRWPLARAAARDVALATVWCGDFAPDRADVCFGPHGVAPLWDPAVFAAANPHRPGAVALWAWGLSRMLDALALVAPELAVDRAAITGHSRLGKAALWAAAQDERGRCAAINNSGCNGAALSRRRFGERLVHVNTRFPHWFCPAHHAYAEREAELPFDQHHVLALVAPRALHIGSASEDAWADPRGEFLGLVAAAEAWGLAHPPTATDWPAPSGLVRRGPLAYHLRRGSHDILAEDWEHYLDSYAAALRQTS